MRTPLLWQAAAVGTSVALNVDLSSPGKRATHLSDRPTTLLTDLDRFYPRGGQIGG